MNYTDIPVGIKVDRTNDGLNGGGHQVIRGNAAKERIELNVSTQADVSPYLR